MLEQGNYGWKKIVIKMSKDEDQQLRALEKHQYGQYVNKKYVQARKDLQELTEEEKEAQRKLDAEADQKVLAKKEKVQQNASAPEFGARICDAQNNLRSCYLRSSLVEECHA